MNHIFGPVNSRRLGRSLGIDLFLKKICNLNCIYCEVGPTDHLTCQRDEYTPTADIICEINKYCLQQERVAELDFVTVTASGEPTLHTGFGEILSHLKQAMEKPVAVLTNGTTLSDPAVRKELSMADVVIPSLDAARLSSFRRIDRPATCLDLESIIDGLLAFSREYTGQIWLEILLAQGINDSKDDIDALRRVTSAMRIDRIQLNTVARPPLEAFALPLPKEAMAEISRKFHQDDPDRAVDLLASGADQKDGGAVEKELYLANDAETQALLAEIIEMLKRRPCTAADINRTFHLGGPDKVEQLLDPLVRGGRVQQRVHGDRLYYQ